MITHTYSLYTVLTRYQIINMLDQLSSYDGMIKRKELKQMGKLIMLRNPSLYGSTTWSASADSECAQWRRYL